MPRFLYKFLMKSNMHILNKKLVTCRKSIPEYENHIYSFSYSIESPSKELMLCSYQLIYLNVTFVLHLKALSLGPGFKCGLKNGCALDVDVQNLDAIFVRTMMLKSRICDAM